MVKKINELLKVLTNGALEGIEKPEKVKIESDWVL